MSAIAIRPLAEQTFREAARLAGDPKSVILLPLGAVEQHGPHLPLLVDWLGAEELARVVSRHLRRGGYRPVLAPALPYGVSSLARSWSGTVSLSTETLRRAIIEIVRGLASHGFRRFVLVNYQADPEHLRAMGQAQRALTRSGRLQVLFAGFAPGRALSLPMVNGRALRLYRSPRPTSEWHSGEMETALVLAVRPGLVRQGIARRLKPVWVDFRAALARGARTFEEINPDGDGYFGWPGAARAATGRKVIAFRGRLFADRLLTDLRAWRPKGSGRASSP